MSGELTQSLPTSPSSSSKLAEIFEALSDINLEGQIEDQEAKPLGLGSSSDIFRARCTSRNKIVAVKRIRIFLLDNISFARNLGREVRLWSKLEHPNVLPLLGYFLEGSKQIPNLVSEWMKNGTLIEYMRDRPFDALEMCRIIREIASGLRYIHTERNMIHADLKGSNILVSDDGRPLLADFGLSVSSGSTSLGATTFHGQKGSLRWMAKELHHNSTNSLDDILDDPKHTTMTDVWAFGMIISELLTKKIPYESINDHRITVAIRNGMLPQEPDFRTFPNSVIFRGLWGVARDCWRDNPMQRPSASDIHEELLSFQRDLENIRTNVKAEAVGPVRPQDLVLQIEKLQVELKDSKTIIQALSYPHPNNNISAQDRYSRSKIPPRSTTPSWGIAGSSASASARASTPSAGAASSSWNRFPAENSTANRTSLPSTQSRTTTPSRPQQLPSSPITPIQLFNDIFGSLESSNELISPSASLSFQRASKEVPGWSSWNPNPLRAPSPPSRDTKDGSIAPLQVSSAKPEPVRRTTSDNSATRSTGERSANFGTSVTSTPTAEDIHRKPWEIWGATGEYIPPEPRPLNGKADGSYREGGVNFAVAHNKVEIPPSEAVKHERWLPTLLKKTTSDT